EEPTPAPRGNRRPPGPPPRQPHVRGGRWCSYRVHLEGALMQWLLHPDAHDLVTVGVESDRGVVEYLVRLPTDIDLANLLSFLHVEGEDDLLGRSEQLKHGEKTA